MEQASGPTESNEKAAEGLGQTCLMRDAAAVKRWHTKRVLKEQSVGAHSFNMLLLLMEVWPDHPHRVMKACIHHDLPELITGDIPAPVKWRSTQMAIMLEEMEKGTGPLYQDFGLTSMEESVVKWCDSAELALYCLEELQMGNTFVATTIAAILRRMYDGPRLAMAVHAPTGPATRRIYNGIIAHAALQGVRNLPPYIN